MFLISSSDFETQIEIIRSYLGDFFNVNKFRFLDFHDLYTI